MKKRPARKSRRSHRAYRRNPAKTVGDPHGARELALTYDNERAQQGQKESIINNLARKMAKGQYDRAKAVKLWGYAAKSGADAYAKQFGSHGDTGSKMFNAATRAMAAAILESENREYVEERAERFAPKKAKKNPSRKHARRAKRSHRRNPAPSVASRHARLERYRDSLGRGMDFNEVMANRASISSRDKRLRGMQSRNRKRLSKGGFGPTPSLSYIQRETHETAPHFFDAKTLKFFGQRKSDFKIMKSKLSGRVFIGAPSRTHKGMFTLREFVGNRLKTVSGEPRHWIDVRDWVSRQ